MKIIVSKYIWIIICAHSWCSIVFMDCLEYCSGYSVIVQFVLFIKFFGLETRHLLRWRGPPTMRSAQEGLEHDQRPNRGAVVPQTRSVSMNNFFDYVHIKIPAFREQPVAQGAPYAIAHPEP